MEEGLISPSLAWSQGSPEVQRRLGPDGWVGVDQVEGQEGQPRQREAGQLVLQQGRAILATSFLGGDPHGLTEQRGGPS